MESRGIYMSSDIPTAKIYGDGLLVFNDRIGEVVNEWQHSVRSEDAALFEAFSRRIRQFQEFRRELVRRGVEIGPAAGREWGDNDANRTVRKALNEDLTKLGELYTKRSHRIYEEINNSITRLTWLTGVTAIFAVMLAALGAVIIWRAVARPLARITRITQAVAAGNVQSAIPFSGRRDEVGALARSIAVFQETMRKNEDLSRTVLDEAQARARRQEEVSQEISRFGAEVEATLSELGRISNQMLAASGHLTGAADTASMRTTGGVGRRFQQRARHRLGRRRAGRLSDGDRSPGGAIQCNCEQGGERGGVDPRHGQGAQ
jgi:methyl-accepting chemotaxis protein